MIDVIAVTWAFTFSFLIFVSLTVSDRFLAAILLLRGSILLKQEYVYIEYQLQNYLGIFTRDIKKSDISGNLPFDERKYFVVKKSFYYISYDNDNN